MLPDFSPERISSLAIHLNQLYREASGTRVAYPETRNVVLELFRRGYRLGLVSNTTSSIEVPAALAELNLTGSIETVILSTVVGKRKPDPAILLEATRRMDLAPEKCAYIGDRVDRDVAAARKAGFSMAIVLRDPRHPILEKVDDSSPKADAIVNNLTGLLDIFTPRPKPDTAPVAEASLSTMWAIGTLPTLTDFREFARRTGFARIELNHKINSAMLDGMALNSSTIGSIHEPCPADIPADELKKSDRLVSSLDEELRRQGVDAIKRSIDLAGRLGVSAIVIHAGHVTLDSGPEKKLRALIASGARGSADYEEIHGHMIQLRAESAAAHFESVRNSILELLSYAEGTGVYLGIENRYHYMEFPSPDELGILLELAGPERIGFIYDVGHAEALDRLGFYPHEEWLKRYSSRIIGTHLHDVVGTTDHYAPGLGTVDFDMVAKYLPENAFRTCEFQTFNTPEQVKAGLRFLVEHDCIKLRNIKGK
jgi:HAD superfamily hydrolase (TIGR01549 family)